MTNNEIVHFTHNDLDALGCMLNLHAALPNTPKQTFHTNYKNIVLRVQETEEYIKQYHIELLVISDVSFSQHRDLLEILIATGVKIIYLDHHVYPEEFFDGLDITYVHDITKAATLITHEYFGNQSKNENLDKITKLINIYDLWQMEEAHFNTSVELNQYFWTVDITWLFNEIINNNYKLPTNYVAQVAMNNAEAVEALKRVQEKGLLHSDGTTSIAFLDNYFNQLLIREFAQGRKAVLIANSYGIIRIRLKQDGLDDDVKRKIKHDVCGTVEVGHLNAFTLKVEHNSFGHIMDEIKRISAIIKKYT